MRVIASLETVNPSYAQLERSRQPLVVEFELFLTAIDKYMASLPASLEDKTVQAIEMTISRIELSQQMQQEMDATGLKSMHQQMCEEYPPMREKFERGYMKRTIASVVIGVAGLLLFGFAGAIIKKQTGWGVGCMLGAAALMTFSIKHLGERRYSETQCVELTTTFAKLIEFAKQQPVETKANLETWIEMYRKEARQSAPMCNGSESINGFVLVFHAARVNDGSPDGSPGDSTRVIRYSGSSRPPHLPLPNIFP